MMKKRKIFRFVGIGIVIFLIVAQFFPIEKTNPKSDPSLDFLTITDPSKNIAENIKGSCYDCHSNEVRYPWYTDVAPVSWWVKSHIENGRKHLNFSLWGQYDEEKKNHKLDECVFYVEKNWMPLLSYKFAHPSSKLSVDQREELIVFFRSLQVD